MLEWNEVRILSLLYDEEPREMTVSEISKETGIPISTVSRRVRAMKAGEMCRAKDGAYTITKEGKEAVGEWLRAMSSTIERLSQ